MNPPPPPPPPLTSTLSTLKNLINQTTTTLSSLQLPTQTSLIQCPNNPNHFIQPHSLFSHYLTCSNTQIENITTHNNFFYRNYPSPVTITSHPPPVLTLPNTLSRECNNIGEIRFPISSITFLPSDIWSIQKEIESWSSNNSFNNVFSFRVLRVFVRLWECDLSRVYEWVVVRSVYYGIVIDYEMRDYLLLLVMLCLKAVVREAVEVMDNNVDESGIRFECPLFKEVAGWLGEKFGLLYGVNGRVFAVEVVKECVIESAMSGSLFGLEEEKTSGSEVKTGGSVGGSVITVEQVEKAVMALYERSLLEEKIRAARDQRQLSAYQRNMEHSYVTKVAEEERRKRPDYKPIIEHDSLLWNQSRNQDTNKTKTREELLAEERDYKRRRMSYRGKKSKRSAVEVMRDIIEVYMEEMKQSEMISSTSEPVEEAGTENKHLDDYKNDQSSSHDYHDLKDLNKNVNIVKHDRDDYLEKRGSHSRDPHHRDRRDRSRSKSREENYHKTERRDREYNNRKRARYEDEMEYRESGRRRTKRDDRERNEDYSTYKDRERRKTSRSSSSRPERYNDFEDRYDPTASREES